MITSFASFDIPHIKLVGILICVPYSKLSHHDLAIRTFVNCIAIPAPTRCGMLGLGMQVLLARHYLHNLSQEVKKGLDQRMLFEGKWAFQAPFGYINKEREIEPDPDRFDTIQQAWEKLTCRLRCSLYGGMGRFVSETV